jgi:23S rRNA (guanosine2251-2'-O)-methyltransferase
MSGDLVQTIVIDGPSRVIELLETSPELVKDVRIRLGMRGDWVGILEEACKKASVPLKELEPQRFERDRERPEGCRKVFARFRFVERNEIDDLLDEPATPERTILALDNISDPGNLGAMIRSAVFFGARDIVLPKRRTCPITGIVAIRSSGALAHARIHRVTNLARSLDALRKHGYWVVGSVLNKGEHLDKVDLTGPTVLIIGSEGKGMRPLVQKSCDLLINLPVEQGLGSLNASTFAGILLYQRWLAGR